MAVVKDYVDRIVANPDDDALRDELAAVLEKRGNERGEFIRLQMEAYRAVRRGEYAPKALRDRADGIARAYSHLWIRGIDSLVDDFRFRRGFPEWIQLSGQKLLDNAAQIFRVAPVRHVRLTDAAPLLHELMDLGELEQVRSLGFYRNRIGDEGAAVIAGSPRLAHLRWLDLRFNGITDEGVEAIAASPHLAELRFADFYGNECEPVPVAAGIDALDGSIQDTHRSALNARLVEAYGPKPWLTAVFAEQPDPDGRY